MARRLALLGFVLVAGCAAAPARPAGDGRATVIRVIDGDTIDVRIGGAEVHVRLLGIDTPETHKEDTPVECFGPEAAAHLAALLPAGTVVRLVRDVESRDRYDRLLAYVYRDRDSLFVDLAMVTDGYAGTLSISPNVAHRRELAAAVADARAAGRGLWKACGGNHVPSRG